MCKYCVEREDGTIKGKDFILEKTAGYENNYMIHDSWLLKMKNDRKAAIMFTTYNTNGVFFNINYCPICGRKLVDE